MTKGLSEAGSRLYSVALVAAAYAMQEGLSSAEWIAESIVGALRLVR